MKFKKVTDRVSLPIKVSTKLQDLLFGINSIYTNTEYEKQQELQKIIKRFFEKDVLFWFRQNEISEFEKVFSYIFQNIGNLLKIE